MKKLKEQERPNLLAYLKAEPEINMFFIGIIENFSLDSDEACVYVEENPHNGSFNMVILKHYENYILYSHDDSYQLEEAVDFLKEDIVDTINGKEGIIRRIAPFFPQMKIEEKSVFCLGLLAKASFEHSKVKTKMLKPDDAASIIDLYAQNIAYEAGFFANKEKYIAERRSNLEGNGFAVGLFYRNKLVSVAEISADNDLIGLITGVATHPKYYGRGFATHAITVLCEEAFRQGIKHISVFQDNPKIMSLLKKIGFEEKGQYALLH
ncbi:MAG: GNAT family N-acetyltransferase [Lachnospiraceae bacterium]|nr:GNAT family N-acetyltransferase [Lachnospiraceae bacterium]